MDRRKFLAAAALVPSLPLFTEAFALAADDGGWIQLFNGKDLEGWTPKIRNYELGDNYADTCGHPNAQNAGRMKHARRVRASPLRKCFCHQGCTNRPFASNSHRNEEADDAHMPQICGKIHEPRKDRIKQDCCH